MSDQYKELNHIINMLYRQLGKELHEDLKNDKLNVRKYKSRTKKIENVIKAIRTIGISMDSVEDEDMKVILGPEKDDEGLFHYKFCPSCHAGNNPEATHCIRCGKEI